MSETPDNPRAVPGDNSGAGGIAADALRSFLERIERLEEEIKDLNGDKKDIFAEAKGNGFDTAIMRQLLRLRKKDPAERQEERAILELYMKALGILG